MNGDWTGVGGAGGGWCREIYVGGENEGEGGWRVKRGAVLTRISCDRKRLSFPLNCLAFARNSILHIANKGRYASHLLRPSASACACKLAA